MVAASARERVDRLVRDIRSVRDHGEIKIFAGEANSEIYDNPEVCEAFKEAKGRQISIRMIIGPILCASEESGSTCIADLAKDTIQIYFRPQRHSLPHYRIMKDSTKIKCYIQSIHPVLELGKEASEEENEEWVNELDEDFEKFITYYKLSVCTDAQEDFILLKPSQIEAVKRLSQKLRRDFEYLTKNEIATMLKSASN